MIISKLLANIASQRIFSLDDYENVTPKCPLDIPLTCQNSTTISDQCCFEYPGGIFLQTQFWNYKPSKPGLNETDLIKELGPLDSFTIHGLWPDNCLGSYEQFCDKDLFIDDVYHLLHSDRFPRGQSLYKDMDLYWKSNIVGGDESLWIHEFNKHGTCIKNIRPQCYSRWNSSGDSKDKKSLDEDGTLLLRKQQAVFDYFNITVNLFKNINTYEILYKGNIIPTTNRTYSKREIERALSNEFNNSDVFINCNNRNELQEIWYFHSLQGSILNEQFVPVDALDSPPFSRCKENGIKYYPKGYIPDKGSNPNLPPWKRGRRGILKIVDSSTNNNGFIIKDGKWMKNGTPANFQLIPAPFGSFHLRSRKGFCAIDKMNSILECKYKNSKDASTFEYDEENNRIGYSGMYLWGSKDIPTRRRKSNVYHINDNNKDSFINNFHIKFNSL